jgi:hypothetical protein
LAVALGLVWPGEHLVMESDPSGGALSFRMRHAHTGELLEPEPTVASLGAVARLGLPPNGLMRFTQPTTLGVAVIPGPLTAERYAPLRSLWPQIATELCSWRGTVVADLGRMQPGHAALPVARAATAVLLVGRSDVEGLFGLRERAVELAHVLGDPDRERPSVAVVVTGAPDTRREALRSAEAMLAAAGSPVPVAGFFAQDPAGARALWAGQVTRRLAGGELIRSARSIAETVMGWWPALAAPAEVPDTDDAGAVPAPGPGRDLPAPSVNPFLRLEGQAVVR